MPGHPNQSEHIINSTAKCKNDTNSDGPDKYNFSFWKLICNIIAGH